MPCEYVDSEDLERYALARIAESETARIEEHLLVCDECRQRLTDLDRYHAALTAALSR